VDHLILVIKNWPNNAQAQVGYDEAYKLMNIIDFLVSKSIVLQKTISSLKSKVFLRNILIFHRYFYSFLFSFLFHVDMFL
jgi:hypothetical protein